MEELQRIVKEKAHENKQLDKRLEKIRSFEDYLHSKLVQVDKKQLLDLNELLKQNKTVVDIQNSEFTEDFITDENQLLLLLHPDKRRYNKLALSIMLKIYPLLQSMLLDHESKEQEISAIISKKRKTFLPCKLNSD